jgi:MFS family permease
MPDGAPLPDSLYAWGRVAVSLGLATVGGIGLWAPVVVLTTIENEFNVGRAGGSLPYTATMVGFAIGGVTLGRLADRFGILPPLLVGAVTLGLGFIAGAFSTSYWQFILIQAVLIGMLGSSATFGPLVADTTHWFQRNRGIAVAIVASGNYLAGTIWPPVLEYAISHYGWREAYFGIGILCIATMLPLAFFLKRRPSIAEPHPVGSGGTGNGAGVHALLPAPRFLQPLLMLAGIACCVAMSMPQVHIVAYCSDLGYGPARGTEMLSLMLGMGVISRLGSGLIADRIGGVGTLLLGSVLQGIALLLFLPSTGLVSLYYVSALFGLFQGGIVPAYALIVREHFDPREAGARTGVVLMATLFGMALGGWMSGVIFDLTGSYKAAFLNGIAWNLLNLSIAFWLLRLSSRAPTAAPAFRGSKP